MSKFASASVKDALLALKLRPGANRGEESKPTAPRVRPEDLDPEQREAFAEMVEAKLIEMVQEFELETDVVRRHHVRRLLKAEEYWKGNQHLIWNERQFRWYTPFEKAVTDVPGGSDPNQPRFQYVNNIYRAFGLSIMAAISQKIPKVRYKPKSAKSEKDIATARAADDVMDVIERNNAIDLLTIRCAYLMWTQGLIGAYVRYVVDEDFGEHDEPVIEESTVEIAPDRFQCQNCAQETPEDSLAGLSPNGLTCPGCSAPYNPETDFRPAEHGQAPVVTGFKKYPNGQEVITLYGGLHLKLMPTAERLKDTLYLILVEEQHQASIRAAHPGKIKEIQTAQSMAASDTFEKNARLSLADASNTSGFNSRNNLPFSKMVTYKRAWLRPESFYTIDDDQMRDWLLENYPKGVLVILADNTFLEARSESMDDKWKICRPMPGTGMYTDAVGADTIPGQDQVNDAQNVVAEHIEYGSAPPTLFDARYIKGQALQSRRMEPGSWFPVMPEGMQGDKTLDSLIYQPELKIDSNIYGYGKGIIEYYQTISGAMPTIFGAPIKGQETASGYSMAREQALGKLGLFWRAVKQFWSEISLIAVQCFAENRTDDYELVVEERSEQYSSEYIHLEDLKGNVTAEAEADEDLPTTIAEMRENILQLLKIAPQQAGAILLHPANAALLKKVLASPDLVMPMDDQREKQYREIDQLLEAEPTFSQFDPGTGQPLGDPESSVQPEVMADDHDAHIETVMEWAVGDKGLEAKKMNPAGYANNMAHILDHYRAKSKKQMFIQQLEMQLQAMMQPQPQPQAQPQNAAGGPQGKPQKTVGDMVEEALPGAGKAVEQLAQARVQ